MRQYETAFLIAPNLPEEDNEELISQMAEVVSKKKGNMINVDEWGKRRLAYPIQKFEEAYYVFFLYEGEAAIPVELERRFKQTETIIRYLTVKNEITQSAKKRGRAPTKKTRETIGVKEEKAPPRKKEVQAEEPVKDLEKEPKEIPAEKLAEIAVEKPIEKPKEAPKVEIEEVPEKEVKPDLEKETKDKSKEKPKTEPKEEKKEVKKEEIEAEPKEKPKEKTKDSAKDEAKIESKDEPKDELIAEPKTEHKAESKDKAEEKTQEKLPPEDKEKKET